MVQLLNTPARRPWADHFLGPEQRRDMILPVLSGHESVRQVAREHEVSRNFVARQIDKAQDALATAFQPPRDGRDDVLFHLLVTRDWLEQAALGLMLIGHSSLRGVCEFFRDLFDYALAHITVRNIFQKAVTAARTQNAAVDLSGVRIGAHDEIF